MSSRYNLPFADIGSGIKPSDGAKLFFFEPDGVTPKDTFSDQLVTPTANANPVIADSNGVFGDIFITGEYKNTLKDKNDVQIFGGVVIVENSTTESTDAHIDRLNPATLAIAIDDATLQEKDVVTVKEHTTGKGGSGTWDTVLTTSVTPNAVNKVISTGNALLTLVFREDGKADGKQLGMFTATDIGAKLNTAQDEGIALSLEGGTYQITVPVILKENFTAYNGRTIFDAVSLPAGALGVSSTVEIDVIGLDVDCANTTTMQSAYHHTLEFTPTRRMKLDVIGRNVTNTDNTLPAHGVLLLVGSGASNTSVKLWAKLEGHNILATANSVIGDSGGASQGVFTSFNKAGLTVDVILDSPRASKIYPGEDGDGIHTFDADLGNLTSQSTYVINNPKAWDCSKRGVKIQSPNTVINNMFVDLDLNNTTDGGTLDFETLGVNTVLNGANVNGTTNLTGDGSILVSAANFIGRGLFFDVAAGQNLLRLGPPATNHSIRGGAIKSTKSYDNNAFSMITVEGAASGVIELDTVQVTTKTGSVIRYQGASASHKFILNGLGQAETFANYAFSTATAKIDLWGYEGDYSGLIISATGENGDYTVHELHGVTTGANAVSTVPPMKFIGHGNLKSLTNGILYVGGLQSTITAITQANPAVVTTSAAHGRTTGERLAIVGAGGMVEVNNRTFIVTVIDADEFSLDGEDSTGHTAYTTGGKATVNTAGRDILGSWKVTCTSGTGIGVDQGGSLNSDMSGLQTQGFDSNIHINLNFSDRCVVAHNVGRGAGTHISTTSATNLTNLDNVLKP